MSKPVVIGLTGGIACGKSSVAKHLGGLGCFTIDADKPRHLQRSSRLSKAHFL